jgi:hypothetical protein
MPLRTRDWCKSTLDYLIKEDLLPSYVVSGRYQPPEGQPHRLALSPEAKTLLHYSQCEGPLYEAETDWRRAYQLVRSFSAAGRSERASQWLLQNPFKAFQKVNAGDLLDQVSSAFLREGFRCLDRHDATMSAVFRLEDSCKVIDLPEPYGKWLQLKQAKPRWNASTTLVLDVRCRVYARARAEHEGEFESLLDFTLSTIALPLVLMLRRELGESLDAPQLTAKDEQARMRAEARDAIVETLYRLAAAEDHFDE